MIHILYGFNISMIYFIIPHGSISLYVELCGIFVDTTFIVAAISDQFQVKIIFPCLSSMQDIASPLHKCFVFSNDGEIKTINHSLYHPSRPRNYVDINFV